MAADKKRTIQILIPLGWKRSIAKDDESITSQVTYISPSGTVLSSIAEVCKYLESEDTCKCGLECPLYVSKIFSFNPQVKSIHPKSWQSELDSDERMVKLNEKCCLHQKELRKKYYGHRKKKKSKSLQNEPEPPPKLIIRWKGGQLTSVISDKADKKTLISDAPDFYGRAADVGESCFVTSTKSPISSAVYSTAVASTVLGLPAVQAPSKEKTIKTKNDFKLQWIKVDDEVPHMDHDSGNELLLTPDLDFKHSSPPNIMSSPSYSQSLHGHVPSSIMTFPNSENSTSFNQSAFYKSNFHVKNEPGFDGNAMVRFPRKSAGPMSSYPGMMMNADHKQPTGQLPAPPNFYLPGMNAMSDMNMHVPHSNNPWSQQSHPAGMHQGYVKNKPGIPWQRESVRLQQNMTSTNSHQNQLSSPFDVNTMVGPGSKTPCQLPGQQYAMNSPPPCNPTSPFVYQQRQCVIGASPSHRTNPSPFSNHSSRPSSSGNLKPASPLPTGQWPNSRTGDNSRPHSRSNNPTTPIPSASPLSLPPWQYGNIPFSVKSPEISSPSHIPYPQRFHLPQEIPNMQCNIRKKMDMPQTGNFCVQPPNTRFFNLSFNAIDQWPVQNNCFSTNLSATTISRPQLPPQLQAGHRRPPVVRHNMFGASPSVVYNDMCTNNQFPPRSSFPGGQFHSRVPLLQQHHREPWSSGPPIFGQKVTPMLQPHSSYSQNPRFNVEMQAKNVAKPTKRRRKKKTPKPPTTPKEQPQEELSATSPIVLCFPEMFQIASSKASVSNKTAMSQTNHTTTSLTSTSSVLSFQRSSHDISSNSDRLGFPVSSLALSPTFEIPLEIFQSSTFPEVQTTTVSKSSSIVEQATSSTEPTLMSPQETEVAVNIGIDDKEDIELSKLPGSMTEQKTTTDADRPVTTPPLPLMSPTHSLGDEGNDDFSDFASDVPAGFDFHDSSFTYNTLSNSPCPVPTSAVISELIQTRSEDSLPDLSDRPSEKSVFTSGSIVGALNMEPTVQPSTKASSMVTSSSDNLNIAELKNSAVISTSIVSAVSFINQPSSLVPSLSTSMTSNTELVMSSGKIFQVPNPISLGSAMEKGPEINPSRYGVKRRWSDSYQLPTDGSKCFIKIESKRRLSDSYSFSCKKQCLDIDSQMDLSRERTENPEESSKTSNMYSISQLCTHAEASGTLLSPVTPVHTSPVHFTPANSKQTVNVAVLSTAVSAESFVDDVLPSSPTMANVHDIATKELSSKDMLEIKSASVSLFSKVTEPDSANMPSTVKSSMEVSSCKVTISSESLVLKSEVADSYEGQGDNSKLNPCSLYPYDDPAKVPIQESLENAEVKVNSTADKIENLTSRTTSVVSLDEKDIPVIVSFTHSNQKDKDSNPDPPNIKESIEFATFTPSEIDSTERLHLEKSEENPKIDLVNNNICEFKQKKITAIVARTCTPAHLESEEKTVPSSDEVYNGTSKLKSSQRVVIDEDNQPSSAEILSPASAETESANDVMPPSSTAGVTHPDSAATGEKTAPYDVETSTVADSHDQELKLLTDLGINNKTEEFSEQRGSSCNDKHVDIRDGKDEESEPEGISNHETNPADDEPLTRNSPNLDYVEEGVEVNNLESSLRTHERELDTTKEYKEDLSPFKDNTYGEPIVSSPSDSDKIPKDINSMIICPTDKDTESEIAVEQSVSESFHDEDAEKQLGKNAWCEDLYVSPEVFVFPTPASTGKGDIDEVAVLPLVEVESSTDRSEVSDSGLPSFENEQDQSCLCKNAVSIIEEKQDNGNATELPKTKESAVEESCEESSVLSDEFENCPSNSDPIQSQSPEVEDKILDISKTDLIECETSHDNIACSDVTGRASVNESEENSTGILVKDKNNEGRVENIVDYHLPAKGNEDNEVVQLTDLTSVPTKVGSDLNSSPTTDNSETAVENKTEGKDMNSQSIPCRMGTEVTLKCTQDKKGSAVYSTPVSTTAPSLAIPQELTHTVIRQLSTYNTLLKNLLVSSVGPNSSILSELGDGTGQPTEQQMKMLTAVANPAQPYLMPQVSSVSPAMLLYQNPVFRRACTMPDTSTSTSVSTSNYTTEKLSSSIDVDKAASFSSASTSSISVGCEEKKKATTKKSDTISHHGSEPSQEKTTMQRKNSKNAETVFKPSIPTTVDSPQMPSTSMSNIDSEVPGPSRGVCEAMHGKSVQARTCHSLTQGLQVPIVSSSVIGTHGTEGDEDTVHGKSDGYDATTLLHNEVSTSQPSSDDSPSVENIVREKQKVPDIDVTSKCSTVGSSTEPMQRKKRGRPRCSPRQNLKRGTTHLPEKSAPPKRAAAIASASMLSNLRQRPATLVDKVVHKSFKNGDLVWGQMRGFPSWPGKIVRASEVRGIQQRAPLPDGKVWVKWFGDHTFAQMNPTDLKTMTEGLELHHKSRKKGRTRNRKISIHLETAIQEAVDELEQQQKALAAKKSAMSASTSLSVSQTETTPAEILKPRRGRKRKLV